MITFTIINFTGNIFTIIKNINIYKCNRKKMYLRLVNIFTRSKYIYE